jgi:hypothetical protein
MHHESCFEAHRGSKDLVHFVARSTQPISQYLESAGMTSALELVPEM